MLLRDVSSLARLPYSVFQRDVRAKLPATLKRLGFAFASLGFAICLFAGSASAKAHWSHKAPKTGSHARARKAQAPGGEMPAPTTAHVETWAVDDGCNGGAGASSALVRQWVTFAESNCGSSDAKPLVDCHSGSKTYCDVMQYLDTDWQFSDAGLRFASAASIDWWLHDPSPNQGVYVWSGTGGGGNLINQRNPATQSFFRSYVRTHYNSDNGLMMDWQSPSLSQELYYSTCGCASTAEIQTDQALRAGHEEMSAALTHSNGAPFVQVDNSLSSNPNLPQGLDMLNRQSGVDGLVAEGEPEDDGTLDPYYSTLLDEIAYVGNKSNSFVVALPHGAAGAPYQQQSRRVQEATILLGYSPGHLVDSASLEDGSDDLAVWPEEGIYPTRPVQSMGAPGGEGCLAGKGTVCSVGGHHNLQVAPGVFRREFRTCYRGGVRFGACAAIVNTTAKPVTVRASWLSQSYGHQITLDGGDIQSGGTINLAGAPFTAGSIAIDPHDAMLLAS